MQGGHGISRFSRMEFPHMLRGLRLRRVDDALAIAHTSILPSVHGNVVGTLG